MKLKDIFGAIIAIVLCEAVGGIGSIFTMPEIAGWYAGIEKSFLNPPSWVFGPVWTLLFALMGIALFLVWRERKDNAAAQRGIKLFTRQLILNVLWSYFFFGMHSPGWALFDLVILWLLILLTIREFKKVSLWAAWLLVPYILWVSFAAYLNLAVVLLN